MFHLSKRSGLFQAPPEMVRQVWEWVLPRYAALVYSSTKDIRLKELAGRDCGFNPQAYSDYDTTIPLSLEGWKYDDEEFRQALEEWKDMWSDIKVSLYYIEKPEYYGEYIDEERAVDIILNNKLLYPKDYEKAKRELYRNIEHEIMHVGQYIFKHFKGLGFGGMPRKEIPTEEEEYKREHPLRDIEFYPILNDAMVELLYRIRDLPEDMHDNAFRLYVGLTPSFSKEKTKAQEFFAKLKQDQPEKWQKAIKELYKTIKNASEFQLSKRAQEDVDLTKLFPVHLFGGFEVPKGWTIIHYGPDKIQARLHPSDLFIRKYWSFISIVVTEPFITPPLDKEKDYYAKNFSYDKIAQELPKIHDFILKSTIEAEKGKHQTTIDRIFPPSLFYGWEYRASILEIKRNNTYIENFIAAVTDDDDDLPNSSFIYKTNGTSTFKITICWPAGFGDFDSKPEQYPGFFRKVYEFEPSKEIINEIQDLVEKIGEANQRYILKKQPFKLSKRIKMNIKQAEEKHYALFLQPTETMLDYFFSQEGVYFPPDDERPVMFKSIPEHKRALDNAYQTALDDLKSYPYDFEIVSEDLDYKVYLTDIWPVELEIIAEPEVVEKLKKLPVVRGIEELDINQVYV